MKILIAGSREIDDFDLEGVVSSEAELIICGGATGIDSLAEKYADEHHISKLVLRPSYRKYGRAAPLRRNEEMVELADAVIIIWDGRSRGTKHTLEYAKRVGKQVLLIKVDPS